MAVRYLRHRASIFPGANFQDRAEPLAAVVSRFPGACRVDGESPALLVSRQVSTLVDADYQHGQSTPTPDARPQRGLGRARDTGAGRVQADELGEDRRGPTRDSSWVLASPCARQVPGSPLWWHPDCGSTLTRLVSLRRFLGSRNRPLAALATGGAQIFPRAAGQLVPATPALLLSSGARWENILRRPAGRLTGPFLRGAGT